MKPGDTLVLVCDPPVAKTIENVHGVQRIIAHLIQELEAAGIKVIVITCLEFGNAPKGTSPYKHIRGVLDGLEFDAIHIATQGLLGLLALRYCLERGLRCTAAYHTLYPEWLHVRHRIPKRVGYTYIRWFMRRTAGVIVPTASTASLLQSYGVPNASVCPYGVDLDRFKPAVRRRPDFLPHCTRPLILYVGRIMLEKGVAELCAMAHRFPGTLVMVGEGPLLEELAERYPHVYFAGKQIGDDLVEYYQHAAAFAFPSRTDTSGLVLTEALACGLPVAALPVIGPRDIVTDPRVGALSEDLVLAVEQAMTLSPKDCRDFVLANYSWARFASGFSALQVPAGQRRKVSTWSARPKPLLSLLQWLVAKAEDLLFAVEHQRS